jgi:hypothetical protein
MLTGCKSSEKPAKADSDENLAERVDFDQMAPEALAATVEFVELNSENDRNTIKLSVSEILNQGRNAPSLNQGQEIELTVDPNLYTAEYLSGFKAGDLLTAVLEYRQQGGLGQAATGSWSLISITK